MDEVERSEHTPNHHNRLENDAGEFLNIPNDVMKEESVHIVYRFILPMFCLLENHNRFSIAFIFNVIRIHTLGVALERLSLVREVAHSRSVRLQVYLTHVLRHS